MKMIGTTMERREWTLQDHYLATSIERSSGGLCRKDRESSNGRLIRVGTSIPAQLSNQGSSPMIFEWLYQLETGVETSPDRSQEQVWHKC